MTQVLVPHLTHVVAELLICDKIVVVAVHFIEGLDNVLHIDIGRNKRLFNLGSFQTAKLRLLGLKNLP